MVADFGFYWGHRLAHAVPFLWRFHAVHHAPKHVYFLISARAHPVDNAFIRICGLGPIYILGLGAPQSVQGTLVATLLMLAVTIWGFFIHANIRWRFGPLEWLLATPAFHLWHHTAGDPKDRNFAASLPVWDWLFRTAYLPREFPAAYGVDEPLCPTWAVSQLLHPFLPPPKRAISREADEPSAKSPDAAPRAGVGNGPLPRVLGLSLSPSEETQTMDAKTETLTPAAELAARSPVRIPNESAEYRAARTALLKEEFELRRHLERVAALRRTLPPGGEVTGDYRFMGEDRLSDFAGLFGDKVTP